MYKKNKLLSFPLMFVLSLGMMCTTAIPVPAATVDKPIANESYMFINPKTQKRIDEILDQLEKDLTNPDSSVQRK
ncbi:hypothetical protein ACIQ4I_00195 [Rummeliibacillus sp. NPDC094406]|uniref:hypothetical protein n=1 Tax=Rummeliibacillus sp. NPDC094406 TaxID=3364511 RepID=UPI0038006824